MRVKQRRAAGAHALGRLREQRAEEGLGAVGRRMVGVHGDEDGGGGRQLVRRGGERAGTDDLVGGPAREVGRAAGRDLHDPVRTGHAKPAIVVFSVCVEVMLIAGNANRPAAAASSIASYCAGVGSGIRLASRSGLCRSIGRNDRFG